MSRVRLAAVALLIAGCGAGSSPAARTPCASPSALPAPTAAAAPVSAAADAGQVAPGGTVTFTETIAGPATLRIDCTSPLQVQVTDSTGLAVGSGASAAVSGAQCGPVALAAGASQSYQVAWAVDPALPGGVYTAALVLGDAPQLSLSIAVGVQPGGCRQHAS